MQQRSQDIQQRETELTHDNELSLFICSDGNLSLIFLMEKYVERGSEERVKNIVSFYKLSSIFENNSILCYNVNRQANLSITKTHSSGCISNYTRT